METDKLTLIAEESDSEELLLDDDDVDVEMEEDELEDDEDFSTSKRSQSPTKMTARQRSKQDKGIQDTLIELPGMSVFILYDLAFML